MAIFKEATITVSGETASIDKPIHLYLGDGDYALYININENGGTKIGAFSTTNKIEELEVVKARVCIRKPNDGDLINVDCNIVEGRILFVIRKTFLDELGLEEGDFLMQIHLYDSMSSSANRFTLPPVVFNVRKPLCDLGCNASIVVATAGYSHVDAAVISTPDPAKLNPFIKDGDDVEYDAKTWISGDLITAPLLNKIENAIATNTYYQYLTVDTFTELQSIKTDYLIPGKLVYVKNENIYYMYSNIGLWVKALIPNASDVDNDSIKSDTVTRIEVVSELPDVEEQGVLYIVK